MKSTIIPDSIKEHFRYDQESGLLYRKTKKSERAIRCKNAAGYIHLSFNKRMYQAHRVAWFLFYGEQPKTIDHINRITTDNRIKNLRSVSDSENIKNRVVERGFFIGVRTDKRCNPEVYYVHYSINGKPRYVGMFKCRLQAAMAREMFKNGETINGRNLKQWTNK